jgi:hypothetical protein
MFEKKKKSSESKTAKLFSSSDEKLSTKFLDDDECKFFADDDAFVFEILSVSLSLESRC